MRFLTFEVDGQVRPGLLTSSHTVVDLLPAGFSSLLDLIGKGSEGVAAAAQYANTATKDV